jgi:L-asparaginase
MDTLCIVTTGGTIDKIYFDDKSDYQIGEPQIGGSCASSASRSSST